MTDQQAELRQAVRQRLAEAVRAIGPWECLRQLFSVGLPQVQPSGTHSLIDYRRYYTHLDHDRQNGRA